MITRRHAALIAILCTAVIGGFAQAAQHSNAVEKAFDAIGGRDAILGLRGFSYISSGERFEPAQGMLPTAEAIKASSFVLDFHWDLENDRLSFDWERQILDPLRGHLAYKDVLDGDVGYQTGNDFAFNPPGAATDRALTPERIASLKREFRLLNPQLYLKKVAADANAATIKGDIELDGRTYHVIEVSDVVEPVELFVDAESGRLSKLRSIQNDNIWGDVVTEVKYANWLAPEGSGQMFPHEVELIIGGQTLLVAQRTLVAVNPDFAAGTFALPEQPRTKADPIAAERGEVSSQYLTRWHAIGLPFGDRDQTAVIATPVAGNPDIQHLTGGSHHSLAIKLDTGIVVVEPPLNEARSRAVLNKLSELWPNEALSHLILTHHHFDHMGGIRTYAAAGATIVTSELNKSYVEKALRSSHTLVRDELARVANPEWRVEAVPANGEFSLVSGQEVRAHHAPTVHSEDMLVVYLPEDRLLFVSDLYFPGLFPPNQPLPAPFGDWAQGLRAGLATLDWEIERIAGGHGGVARFSDLHSHFEN